MPNNISPRSRVAQALEKRAEQARASLRTQEQALEKKAEEVRGWTR